MYEKPLALNFDVLNMVLKVLTFKNLTVAHGSILGANAFSLSVTPPSLLTHNKGAWIDSMYQSSKKVRP
jgi:hypothetical protein